MAPKIGMAMKAIGGNRPPCLQYPSRIPLRKTWIYRILILKPNTTGTSSVKAPESGDSSVVRFLSSRTVNPPAIAMHSEKAKLVHESQPQIGTEYL